MADDDNTNNVDNRDILEEQGRSLEELVAEMKQQSRNVEESVDSNVDVEKSIKALEGSLGIDSNENTVALRESFANVNAVMQEQVALQEQGLPFDQELLNSAQDQLETIKSGVKSEEDRREAIKKQEEANSLLGKVVGKLDSVGGKVKESGGFLAGIAGLATLLLNPQAFAAGLTKILNFVGDMVDVVENIFAGEFDKAGKTLKENGTAIAGILGGLLLFNLGKVIKGVNLLIRGFKLFRLFMLGSFVPTMLSTLGNVMASVGGAFMKVFNLLLRGFRVFRTFMLVTFVPGMISALAGMMSALIPIIIALGPAILIGLAIAAVVGLIYYGLTKLRDALGFESIFDVILLGVAHMKDGFARMQNFFIKLAQKIAGMGGALLEMLGIEVPDSIKNAQNMELVDTDNAAKAMAAGKQKKIEADAKRAEEAAAAANKPAIAETSPLGMPIMPDMSSFGVTDTADATSLELDMSALMANPIDQGSNISEMSAENLLANMPATTENNVVNQVQTSNTQNSGNSSTTIIQGHRPSRTGDFLASGHGSFAR